MTTATHTARRAVAVPDPGERRATGDDRHERLVDFIRPRAVALRPRVAPRLMPTLRPRQPLAGLA